jgi:LPS-assembly lipoprotein
MRALRPLAALALAGLVAGCFQPLYGEHSATGGPSVTQAMRAVDVLDI